MMSEIHIAPENVWKIDWLVEIVRRASDSFENGKSVQEIDMKTPWRRRKAGRPYLTDEIYSFATPSLVGGGTG